MRMLGALLTAALLATTACHHSVLVRHSPCVAKTVVVGRVWASPSAGSASCFVIREGHVEFLGSDADDCRGYNRDACDASVLDFGDSFVTPGLVDAHVHLIPAGMLPPLDLSSVASPEAFLSAVRAAAEGLGDPGDWVLGYGWDEGRMGGWFPTRQDLDSAAKGRPVWLRRVCAHAGVASTAALAAGGVALDGCGEAQGLVLCGADGTATGLLREGAMARVTAAVPAPGAEARRQAVMRAQGVALARGVTAVGDMGEPAWSMGPEQPLLDWTGALAAADHDGELLLRVRSYLPITLWARVAELAGTEAALRGWTGGRLSLGGVKEFADGTLGSRTAWFWDAYADGDGTGVALVDPAWLEAEAAAAMAAGLGVAVHAIGDRAVDEVAGALLRAQARAEVEWGPLRGGVPGIPRIEHVQHISGPATAELLAAGWIRAVVNPLHMAIDIPGLEQRLGPSRATPSRAFPLRLLLDAGVRVSAGSDWPIVDLDPLGGMLAAVAGVPGTAGRAWGGASAEEALAMDTAWAAEAMGMAGEVGTLEAGAHADFVVWDSDVLEWLACMGRAARGGLNEVCGERPGVERVYAGGRCVVGCSDA